MLNNNLQLVGIDGCNFGWVAVCLDHDSAELFSSLNELLSAYNKNAIFLIDMPIGLASEAMPVRDCENLARKIFSAKRKPSLFPIPCREAVYAESYE